MTDTDNSAYVPINIIDQMQELHSIRLSLDELKASQARVKELEEQVSRLVGQAQATQQAFRVQSEGHRSALDLVRLRGEAADRMDRLAVKTATSLSIEELILEWPKVKKSNSSLAEQLREAQQRIEEMSARVNELNSDLEEMRTTELINASVKLELQEANSSISELRTKVHHLSVDRGQYARKLKVMSMENTRIIAEISDFRASADSAHKQIKVLRMSRSYRFARLIADRSKSIRGTLSLLWQVPIFFIKESIESRNR